MLPQLNMDPHDHQLFFALCARFVFFWGWRALAYVGHCLGFHVRLGAVLHFLTASKRLRPHRSVIRHVKLNGSSFADPTDISLEPSTLGFRV